MNKIIDWLLAKDIDERPEDIGIVFFVRWFIVLGAILSIGAILW